MLRHYIFLFPFVLCLAFNWCEKLDVIDVLSNHSYWCFDLCDFSDVVEEVSRGQKLLDIEEAPTYLA